MEKKNDRLGLRISEDTREKLDFLIQENRIISEREKVKPKTTSDIVEESIKQMYYSVINKTQDADVVDRINNTVDETIDSKTIRLESYVKQMKDQNDELLNVIHNLEHQNELLLKGLSVVLRSDLITNPDNFKKEQIFAYLDRESNWIELIKEWMEINK